jgi:predicted Zn-dependent peptidase
VGVEHETFCKGNNYVIMLIRAVVLSFSKEAEAAFAGLPSGSVPQSAKTVYIGGESHVESESEPLFVLAYPSGALSSREFLVAGVLQEVLGRTPDRIYNKPRPGDGLNSRLARRLSPEAAVLYADSFVTSYSDGGLFGVQAQALAGNEKDVLKVITDETGSLAKTPLSDAELNGAKLRLKLSILQDAEAVDSRALFYARQALFSGKVLCRNDYTAQIDSVSAKEVQELVQKMQSATPTLVSEGCSANYKRFQ